jgi:hypothetical protein
MTLSNVKGVVQKSWSMGYDIPEESVKLVGNSGGGAFTALARNSRSLFLHWSGMRLPGLPLCAISCLSNG